MITGSAQTGLSVANHTPALNYEKNCYFCRCTKYLLHNT
jgi:hypothetical protein